MEKPIVPAPAFNKYDNRPIRWLDKGDHYELIFTDDFITPSSGSCKGGPFGAMTMPNSQLTDIVLDMRAGDKGKEVHVFVGSFGGEVAALNMILQQLLTYEYRVGINLGTACSCGWMLLFACQERYVSPFSQAMYHDISHVAFGKHSEIQRSAEHSNKWQQQLLKATDASKVLTEREIELGKTSEVWFTGAELIERGAARDYNEYLKRPMPLPCGQFFMIGDKFYARGIDGWGEIKIDEGTMTYQQIRELLEKAPETAPEPKETSEPAPAKPKKSKSCAKK